MISRKPECNSCIHDIGGDCNFTWCNYISEEESDWTFMEEVEANR